MKLAIAGFSVMVVVAACSSKGGGKGGGTTTSHAEECKADADCVVVETQCCDHCNGGKAEAFPKATADSHKPTGCENTACTEMACGQASAKCDAGKCTVVIQKM